MSNVDVPPCAETLPREVTLAVRDACLCLHVQRAARAVARRFDEALRPVGLTNQQFSLLMSLNRPVPPTMGQVAAGLGMDRTTVTANLKPLVRRGLARVDADPADRRTRRLVLADAGRSLLAAAMPLWRAAQDANEELVPDGDPDRLRVSLRALS